MKGSCTIDGIDISHFGMFILREGDNDLLTFPERKEPAQNDWFELEGLDVDLSEVFFSERKVAIQFYLSAPSTAEFMYNLDSFYSIMMMPGYRSIYLRDFDKTFTLRYLGCPAYDHRHGLVARGKKAGYITVDFMMDDPLQVFGLSSLPVSTRPNLSHVTINGLDLSLFGIIIQKLYHTALKAPMIKEGLTRRIERMTGQLADTGFSPVGKSKDITFECTMMADTRSEFYDNYDALFHQATVLEPVVLGFVGERTATCYYSKMDSFVKQKPFNAGVRVTFNLTFKTIDSGCLFIDDLRITEDGQVRITEDGFDRKL